MDEPQPPLSPPVLQPFHLNISINTLFSFVYGDETFYNERVYLLRHTDAIGNCRIVSKSLAQQIYALDPDELFTHIEVYTFADFPVPIHTLWRQAEWRESNEKLRLSKLRSIVRTSNLTQRDDCEYIARLFSRKVFPSSPHADTFYQSLLLQAREVGNCPRKFAEYCVGLNTTLFPDREMCGEFAHYLNPPSDTPVTTV